jgi:hypothetical protein
MYVFDDDGGGELEVEESRMVASENTGERIALALVAGLGVTPSL